MAHTDGVSREWYYIWAGRVHGPVSPAEFSALVGEGLNPEKATLARQGDDRWMTYAEAQQADQMGPAAGTTGLPPIASIASRPYPETVLDGIGYWLTLGWEMLMADIWAWVLATLLMMVVSGVSMGILAPPLQMGLWLMALRVYDGKPVKAGDVFSGMGLFLPAWGLNIILGMVMFLPVMIFVGVAAALGYSIGGFETMMPGMMIGYMAVFPIFFVIMYFVSIACLFCLPLIAERRAGVIESIGMSWNTVRTEFWGYVVVLVLLGAINSAGAQVCYVGMFVTMPFVILVTAVLYRDRFPAQRTQ